RALVDLFYSAEDGHLGLYGAFGYDLAFQFEPIAYRLTREPAKRDLVLFLPDRLVIVDHTRGVARRQEYELAVDGASTAGLPRSGDATPYRGCRAVKRAGDHEAGELAATVRLAQEAFPRGDLLAVVPGLRVTDSVPPPPSECVGRTPRR